MKNFIYKTNQYLLERHPIIWNLRLVWVLLAGVGIHCLFFILGILSVVDITVLHETRIVERFFTEGTIFFNIIVSVLFIVFWLIYLFKNNAFKNFYPTNKLDLFKQLTGYMLVFFIASSFYYSHFIGVKLYIELNFPQTEFEADLAKAENADAFLSYNSENYSLDNKSYPSPFDTLYCQVVTHDEDSATYKTYNFYTVKSIVAYVNSYSNQRDYEKQNSGFIREERLDDTHIRYYYKDSLIDVSAYLPYGDKLSYYNYSSSFNITTSRYNQYSEIIALEDIDSPYETGKFKNKIEIERNKYIYDLLQRNAPKEIKEILSNFLDVANKYKTPTNLTAEHWFTMVYHPDNFEVTHFIKEKKDSYYPYNYSSFTSAAQKYVANHMSDYYLNKNNLENAFDNIKNIKQDPYVDSSIYIILCIAYVMATILLMFRISNARTFIFSIVTIFILFIIVMIITVFSTILSRSPSNDELVPIIFSCLLIVIAFLISVNSKAGSNKLLTGICVNISVVGFGVFILLLFISINIVQRSNCYDISTSNPCYTISDIFDEHWVPILLTLVLVMQYFYTGIIKKYKALPEG